jgi:type VI secretion system protein VasI
MRSLLIIATVIMAGVGPAMAADCLKIDNDLDRLACYDREAGRTPSASTLPQSAGKWVVRRETSKLTDQPTVVMSIDSDEVVDCGWNRGQKIGLVLRCMENKTVLYFSTGCHMTASQYNDYGNITYRLDDEKARTVSGDASTDNRALGLWNGGKSIPVIKQMYGRKQMIVRMTPYSESPFTATFDISGAEEASKPLREGRPATAFYKGSRSISFRHAVSRPPHEVTPCASLIRSWRISISAPGRPRASA